MSNRLTRRTFLMGSAALAAGCATGGTRMADRPAPRYVSPNQKLQVAAIGSGGKGMSDIWGCRSEDVIALCDADENMAREAMARFPNARFYHDFREMLDKEDLDAVTVSTPDHTHAVAAVAAMRKGMHVYCQKPLTRDIHECRTLQIIANEYGVATQMGNQGHSDDGVRRFCEMLWTGVVGHVREVHVWTNRPVWPQGLHVPQGSDEIPETLDWDLWLGPAADRPYLAMHPESEKAAYHPFTWRGWWDFGTGALGDMACHIMDPANWGLGLNAPLSVEPVHMEGATEAQGPLKSIVKYEFGERYIPGWGVTAPPCTLYWYEGGLLPERPAGVPEDEQLGSGDNGSFFVGDDGIMTCDTYGGNPRLLPASKMEGYTLPEPYLERTPGNDSKQDWIRACKGGPAACSNFDYACPFTEIVLLGCLAQRANTRIEWDSANLRIKNPEAQFAQQWVQSEYRKGWHL